MSRGFGRIERHILAALHSDPHAAFTTDELCARIYRVSPQPKHRSSVLRAMHKLAASEPTVAPLVTMSGAGAAIYSSGSTSGGLVARAKVSLLDASRYRIHPKRAAGEDRAWAVWPQARDALRSLSPDALKLPAEVLTTVQNVQREYSLSFQDAVALLVSYGLNPPKGDNPENL